VIFGQYGPKSKYGRHVSGEGLIISIVVVIKSYLVMADILMAVSHRHYDVLFCYQHNSSSPKNDAKNGPDFFGSTCPKSRDILS